MEVGVLAQGACVCWFRGEKKLPSTVCHSNKMSGTPTFQKWPLHSRKTFRMFYHWKTHCHHQKTASITSTGRHKLQSMKGLEHRALIYRYKHSGPRTDSFFLSNFYLPIISLKRLVEAAYWNYYKHVGTSNALSPLTCCRQHWQVWSIEL